MIRWLLLAAVTGFLFCYYPAAAWAACAAFLAAKLIGMLRRRKRIYGFTEKTLDAMDGHTFEFFCQELLQRNGYRNVTVTAGSGDHGVDILAEKEGVSYAIQCKHYRYKVGNKAVQEVYTGKDLYQAKQAAVLATCDFSPQAIEEAGKLGVILWNRGDLIRMMRRAKTKRGRNI